MQPCGTASRSSGCSSRERRGVTVSARRSAITRAARAGSTEAGSNRASATEEKARMPQGSR